MRPLPTLSLWGDGDEIWAIEEAFEAVGLQVPVEDAPSWFTVGDLWTSAVRISPAIAADTEHWNKFRIALSNETGVDWTEVEATTTLIDGRGHNALSRLFTTLREKMKKAFENA
jgi:hypothetical protein